MRLPQGDSQRCSCHFAPLLDVINETSEDLRLELLSPEGDAWAPISPLVPAFSTWARDRRTPLWIPRVKAVRAVNVRDGLERWRRAPWGDGGVVRVV